MKTIYADTHRKHDMSGLSQDGYPIKSYEKPERAETILQAVTAKKWGDIVAPDSFSLDTALKIHTPDYVEFLQNAHKDWVKQGYKGHVTQVLSSIQYPNATPPKHIEGKVGYYLADTYILITENSWDAIKASADIALTGQKLVSGGEKSAFALCRPPGHHATKSKGGGYCFLNNAAIAAQGFLDSGAKKVAILDVDYHHGNGTQDIFYDRGDVLFASLHAHPDQEYPYYVGYADETGRGKGEGANRNYPMPLGTTWDGYGQALDSAIKDIKASGAETLIVSLGVDAYKEDPISKFKLESEDFLKIGERIAGLGLPTLFVMEGGYAVDAIGVNVTNTLQGFLGA